MTQTPPPIKQPADPQLPVPQPRTVWPIVIGMLALVLAIQKLTLIIANIGYRVLFDLDVELPVSMIMNSFAGNYLQPHVWPVILLTGFIIVASRLMLRKSSSGMLMAFFALLAMTLLGIQFINNLSPINYAAENLVRSSVYKACALFLLDMIFPVFLLIWFSRKKIKDEVRSWGESEN